MEIPDNLLCLFTARIDEREGTAVIDVPERELDAGGLDSGTTYRVAILPTGGSDSGTTVTDTAAPTASPGGDQSGGGYGSPPVEEGDVRQVEIEGIGDQGDGIARVDRGYVVIVPDTDVGDEVEIEIEDLYDNFAMGRVIDDTPDDDRGTETSADVGEW